MHPMRKRKFLLLSIGTIVLLSCNRLQATNYADEKSDSQLLVDTNDFYRLVTEHRLDPFFVDKSLLIKEIVTRWSKEQVILISQPRGFGKTVNSDMLKRFLEMEVNSKGENVSLDNRVNWKLFLGGKVFSGASGQFVNLQPLEIAAETNVTRSHLGYYPVISINFNDIEGKNLNEIKASIAKKLQSIFARYEYLHKYAEEDDLARMLFDQTWCLEEGIWCLCKLLHKHFGRKVIILLDDYDTAIINAYFRVEVIYEFIDLLNFFGRLLLKTFKNNEYLENGLLVGTIPIHKCDLYLANVYRYTLHERVFNRYFGFTRREIDRITKKLSIDFEPEKEFRYSGRYGYSLYGEDIYDPGWITSYLANKSKLYDAVIPVSRHWLQSKQSVLINETLSSYEIQNDLQNLLSSISAANVTTEMDMFDLDTLIKRTVLRKILMFSGFLTPIKQLESNRDRQYRLVMPHREVVELLKSNLMRWVCQTMRITELDFAALLRLLTVNSMEKFLTQLKKSLSGFTKFVNDEKIKLFYRGFAMTLLHHLVDSGSYSLVEPFEGSEKTLLCLISTGLKTKSDKIALLVTYRLMKSATMLKSASKKGIELINSDELTIKKISSMGVKKFLKLSLAFFENKVAIKYQIDSGIYHKLH